MEKKSKIDLLGSINANEKYVQVNFTVSHVYETENRLESLERWFTILYKIAEAMAACTTRTEARKDGYLLYKNAPVVLQNSTICF
jgi:hypothetical protein